MIFTARHLFICILLLFSGGCAQKSAKLQKSVVPPDKTLFETGTEYLKKSAYLKARLSFQTLINTYPDSDMAPEAYMAVGDSFYDEGGTENLLMAEDQYKNFIIFFPTNPRAADAQMKIIALNHKMMHSPDRDQKNSYKAQDAIRTFLAKFPDSDYVPIARQYLLDVQENLAKGDLGVGQYYEEKNNFAGARGRYQEIIDKYQSFSQMDEVLFRLAGVQEKSENIEEAAINYGKIISDFPFSRHAEAAKQRLNSLGKPLPTVDAAVAAANQARVKPPEGFSPLNPFIDFAKALGFVAPPDLYEEARKTLDEEKAKTAQASAAKPGEGSPTGGDIQIESIIKKSASGETQDTTILGGSSSSSDQQKKEEPKETNKSRNKKKNPQKSS